ncbi:DUF5723 family protein [Salegentibacter sp. JZCK2]|uniref:DUF5723 family protein n=1 Tax=Salegentibacter tibetensis TaxID=2873600 RepID=UPI001CC98075|nr:DUF5723 family protein [Salegentibacter tibetensis]MBZ9728457.1 DUF5723 family protein [Salegentibacter tibetensis]
MWRLIFLFFLVCSSVVAQNKPLLFNVDDLPQTLMSNPGAQINFTGHIGIPLFSQIHLSAGTTGVDLYDIFADDGTNINTRIQETMRSMDARDYFAINQQLEIISLGWKLDRKNYLSMGIYQEMDLFAYFPKGPAILVNEGNNDYLNEPFYFDDVSFTGEILTVYHLGINHKFDRRLTVGARAKFYSGVFNAESTGNSGRFTTYTTPNGRNVYKHEVVDLNVLVNTSGFASLREEEEVMTVEQATAELLSRSFFGGNVGFGLDLGLSYILDEQFILSGSVQDLGAVFQRKDVENYRYFGAYETSGLEPLFPDLDENDEAIPYWDIFEDEVDRNLRDQTTYESYTTWRPIKANFAMEYGFGPGFLPCHYLSDKEVRYMNLLGMQLSGVKRPKGFVYALTAYYDRKINENQRFKLTYTLDDYSLTNIGLMYTKTFNKFNVYLAVNNVLAYPDLAKAHSASIQLGMQLVFND